MFDLKHPKYKTRDGRTATITSLTKNPQFPVQLEIDEPVEHASKTETYTLNGSWNGVSQEALDLVARA